MAKLIQCVLCKKEISSSASSCPHCGHKVRSYKFRSLICIILVGIVATCIILNISIVPSTNDFSIASSANNSASSNDNVVQVNAAQLLNDYQANEVSADNMYRGNKLAITGVVYSINRSIVNSYYINLLDGYPNVQANFDSSQNNYLSGLQKGQTINILCIGDGMVAGIPQLKDCTPLNDEKVDDTTNNSKKVSLPECLKEIDNGELQKINNNVNSEIVAKVVEDLVNCQIVVDAENNQPKLKKEDFLAIPTIIDYIGNKPSSEISDAIYEAYSNAYDQYVHPQQN